MRKLRSSEGQLHNARFRIASLPPGQHVFYHPTVIRLHWAPAPPPLEPVKSFRCGTSKRHIWREASPAPFSAPEGISPSLPIPPQLQLALPSPMVSLPPLLLAFLSSSRYFLIPPIISSLLSCRAHNCTFFPWAPALGCLQLGDLQPKRLHAQSLSCETFPECYG